jgi:hypothetical protein
MLVHLTKKQELRDPNCKKLQAAKRMNGDYYNVFVYQTQR